MIKKAWAAMVAAIGAIILAILVCQPVITFGWRELLIVFSFI
jgi:hypothetical protein